MAKDTEEAAPKYSPNTGTDVEAGTFTYYDPATNTFKVIDHNPDDPFANKIGDDYIWGWTPEGDRVVMARPEEGTYYNAEMGDNHWDTAIGTNPNPVPEPSDNPYYNWSGGMNRDYPQPDPTPPALDRPMDSVGPGYEGVLPPDNNAPADPFEPPTGGGGTGGGGAGGGGGGTAPPVDWGDLFDIPLQGWEASTNKDFYQDQFRDMRRRREGEQFKEFASAIRRQQAENAPTPETGDPWAWAGGESQFTPTVGTGFDATWIMPDRYQGLDNASIIAMQGNDYLSKHPDFLAQAPDFTLENREDVLSYLNSNPYTNDKGWVQAVNDFGRGLYTQMGDTVGGLPVPEGYASPI